jgi:hypothetical protein
MTMYVVIFFIKMDPLILRASTIELIQPDNRIRSRAPWSPIFVFFEKSYFKVSKNSNIKFVMLPMTYSMAMQNLNVK